MSFNLCSIFMMQERNGFYCCSNRSGLSCTKVASSQVVPGNTPAGLCFVVKLCIRYIFRSTRNNPSFL